MRKRWIAMISVLALVLSAFTIPTMADATRVVTIGQDLSDEQEAFIINYFGVDLNTTQVIYVNNQQEREYVGSWIPLEQIGNITISSAYVQPTTSGGIQVKTANLTYVTGNMIASVLSTAGVKNCNIVAAAPFPVSGTGALTGVMIAYQVATGENLDQGKRDLAVKEFTVTQQASQNIGEEEALQLVNAVKMEVIASEVPADDTAQIEEIVNQVITNVEQSTIVDNSVNNIDNSYTEIHNGLSEEDRQMIIDLATDIARQEYQYEDLRATLERVEENLSRETNINIVVDNSNSNTNDNSGDVNVDNNTDVNITEDNDVNVEQNQDQSQDQDQDSILSGTNDDLIDATYQSSTRDEDIQIIEEKRNEEAEQEDQPVQPEDSMYDMSAVEEYHQDAEPEPVYPGEEPVVDPGYQPEEPVVDPGYQPEEPVVDPGYQPEEPVYEPEYQPEEPVYEPEYQPEEPVYEPEYQPEEPVYETEYQPEDIDVQPVDGGYDMGEVQEYSYDEGTEEYPAETYVETAPVLMGGWAVYSSDKEAKLPAEVQEAFDMAIMNYDGMNLKPIACLGSQVVAGMNYQLLCEGAPVVPDPQTGLYVVTIYKDLEGNATITNVQDFDLGKIEEKTDAQIPEVGLSGGWFAPEEYEEGELPDDADTAFREAMAGMLGVEYKPVALLGTKVIAGMEYAVLTYAATVTEEPVNYFAVAFVAANADGTYNVMNIVPLNPAEWNQ